MNILKNIVAILISVAFIVNPVMACCASEMDNADTMKADIESGHDCHKMAAQPEPVHDTATGAQETPHQQSPSDRSHGRMMDCEGCAECGLLAQADHLVTPKTAAAHDKENSDVNVELLAWQAPIVPTLNRHILPPKTAPPPVQTPVSLKIRLIV